MSAELVKKRDTVRKILERAARYAATATIETPNRDLIAKLELIEKCFNRAFELQIDIESFCGDDALHFQQVEMEAVEDLYHSAKVKLLTLIDSQVQPVVGNNAADRRLQVPITKAEVKLPRLQIPNFNGDYTMWTAFRDLFHCSIGACANLSGSQKLSYLKSYLVDEAAQLVRSYQISDANFDEAWKAITLRYDNKRLLVNAQFQKLFGQPAIGTESASGLRKLIDATTECVRALNALEIATDNWDSILVYIVAQRLDSETHKQWELSLTHNELPSYAKIVEFVERRCRSLEAANTVVCKSKIATSIPKKQPAAASKSAFHASPAGSTCVLCSKGHRLESCTRFLKMSVYNRFQCAKRCRMCYMCLQPQHVSADCDGVLCPTCKGRHHNLLHSVKGDNQPKPEVEQTDSKPVTTTTAPAAVQSNFGNDNSSAQILLSTALLKIDGFNNTIRALLDSGSQASFISESCVQRLRLQRKRVSVPVNGLGQSKAGCASSIVKVRVRSCVDPSFVLDIQALVLKQLTGILPKREIVLSSRPNFVGIVLADPEYFQPGEIEMLIGADAYGRILLSGLIQSSDDGPTAQNTSLGWVISGPLRMQQPLIEQVESNVAMLSLHLDVEEGLRRFWEIEEVGDANLLSADEEKCEAHFLNTHSRDLSGRFIVRLPFADDVSQLGSSKNAAIKRLMQLERRLGRDQHLKKQYIEFMREYESLGHMQPVGRNRDDSASYYLPHHGVVKETSSTTKLRVVFDGSCKTTSGSSLNDLQLIGPRLQDDLYSIVLRFRQHAVVMTADITKMYRQVLVHPDDRRYQKIVWREEPTEEIREFALTTVTYGMSAAPYLAIRSLRQLAIDEAERFPLASKSVLCDFYVDDMMTGGDNTADVAKLQNELIAMLSCGGFMLRKWSSNKNIILSMISAEDREIKAPLNLVNESAVSTLGLQWYPASDSFGFKVNVEEHQGSVTKRSILSAVARLFDPLGFLAPTIILAKILLQRLWALGLQWDQEVPSAICELWRTYHGTLIQLACIRIPRWLGSKRGSQLEIHAFCDASETAYGSVLYARTTQEDGSIAVTFITAKTKVSPVKQVTVPRLELCAAVLLTKLLTFVLKTLKLEGVVYYAWSDSKVVLDWLHKLPRNWKTFVANRVSYIQTNTSPDRWKYVPTASNPADCASRGVMPSELSSHLLWFSGPDWLKRDPELWPAQLCVSSPVTHLEERQCVTVLATTISEEWDLIKRFSDLRHMKRVTAYVMRFAHNVRYSGCRISGRLTVDELQDALEFWLKRDQQREFQEEISCCLKGQNLPRKSRLLSLSPFVDERGLLRVGGRLKSAPFEFGQKHPIMLLHKSILTKLIVSDIHIRLLHGGIQLMLGYLRRKYWIVGARSHIRQHLHSRVTCFRQKPLTCQQLMGSLPPERVTPSRPFSRSGVDYAGPISIKSSTGRGCRITKGYIALFVCFATKAVHLELVSDLTTAAFLAAFRRFVARRGICNTVFSDCGTNFVGAKRELRELLNLLKSASHNDAVSKALVNDGTNWKLIPPGTPHFGGLWEAGVKSVKHHLRRIVGEQRLTFEELATILAEIEACLNSRPLCALSDDIKDATALTPGHFLIGESPLVVPEIDMTELTKNRLTRWKMVNQLTQHFWHRWRNEYASTLQHRRKWVHQQTNIEVGQLALIKDERLPPAKWALGRIVETTHGKDGLVRVATLQYAGGRTSRTINKLCILPIN